VKSSSCFLCAELIDAPGERIAQGRLDAVLQLAPQDWQLTCCNCGLKVRPEGQTLDLQGLSVGSVVEGAPSTEEEEPRPDASNARSQRPATRATGVSRALAYVLKHPWLPTGVLHCPGHPSCAGA
jgi:hypothetical protein